MSLEITSNADNSIGVSALMFLIYHLKLNIDVMFDPSQAVHNDMNLAVAFAGLRWHLLMTLLQINVPSGQTVRNHHQKLGFHMLCN